MGAFYFALVSTYISGYISRISKNKKILSIFYAFLIFLIIFLISAFRNDIGDTFQYKHSYSLLNNLVRKGTGDFHYFNIGYIQ